MASITNFTLKMVQNIITQVPLFKKVVASKKSQFSISGIHPTSTVSDRLSYPIMVLQYIVNTKQGFLLLWSSIENGYLKYENVFSQDCMHINVRWILIFDGVRDLANILAWLRDFRFFLTGLQYWTSPFRNPRKQKHFRMPTFRYNYLKEGVLFLCISNHIRIF